METFKQFISEHILSIGLNPDHDKHREGHRQEIHDLLRNAYKDIGGYAGLPHGSEEESKAIHSDISNNLIKATKRNNKITAVSLYKPQHGRKAVAIGTDGTPEGKKDFLKTAMEDNERKRAWGEFSGAVEKIAGRIGMPTIPSSRSKELLGKEVEPEKDSEHYTRQIGTEKRRKIMMGHPKTD